MRFVVATAGRVDKTLADACAGAGRARVARALADGRVRVNGRRAKKGDRVLPDDVVEIAGDLVEAPLVPEPGPLAVLHLDESLVALDKPAGMPSHPLLPGETGTLANRIVAAFPGCGAAGADPREAGLVHRLDAGTSGVIVAARTPAAWTALRAAFGERRVHKEYLALVVGQVTRAGEVDAPIAQVDGGRTAMVCADPDEAARRGARPARTTWEPVERRGDFTLLRCHAETGRMHQIRAHLAHAGTPIVGDARYGIVVAGAPALPAGFFLHAAAVEFDHPVTGARTRIEAPLPATWPC